MSVRIVFIINTFVSLAFGCAFVMAPAQLLAQYGIAITAGGGVVAQLFGGALISIGVLCWMARDTEASDARRALVFGLFAGDAIGFVASLLGQIAGAINPLGWTTVALYLLFTSAYGFILLGGSQEAAAPASAG